MTSSLFLSSQREPTKKLLDTLHIQYPDLKFSLVMSENMEYEIILNHDSCKDLVWDIGNARGFIAGFTAGRNEKENI